MLKFVHFVITDSKFPKSNCDGKMFMVAFRVCGFLFNLTFLVFSTSLKQKFDNEAILLLAAKQ